MTDNYRSSQARPSPQPGVPPSLPAPLTAPPAQGAFFGRQPPEPPAPNGREDGGRSNAAFWVIGALVLVAIAAFVAFVAFRGDSGATASQAINDDAEQESATGQGPETSDGDTESEGTSSFFDRFRPDSVALDASSVWVSDAACGVVVQIDKATEEVVGSVNIGGPASGVAVAAGSVWVGGRDLGSVFRVDIDRLAIAESVAVPGSALGLTAQGNDVWVTDTLLGAVYRIDAASGALAETVQVGADPHHIAIGDRTVWVTNQLDDTVSMIATGSGRGPVEMPVGRSPLHVELGAGSAWITDSSDGAVRRLDENTGELQAVIDVGVWPHALAFASGSVWVGTERGSFWQVDPATNTASRVDDADFTSIDAAVDGANIWIADASGGKVVRFDASTGSVGSVVDLNEFGDCNTFRDEAGEPAPAPDISL